MGLNQSVQNCQMKMSSNGRRPNIDDYLKIWNVEYLSNKHSTFDIKSVSLLFLLLNLGGRGVKLWPSFDQKKVKTKAESSFDKKKGKNKSLEDQWNFEIVLHTWLFNIKDLDLSDLCFDLFIKQE